MDTLKRIVRMLEQQRQELLDQLEAVDRAIAALGNAGTAVQDVPPEGPDPSAGQVDAARLPKQVKARRVLSDSHKQALVVGRRKARAAKDVAKGLTREMPDDSFVPAIGARGQHQPPRLVKRAIKK